MKVFMACVLLCASSSAGASDLFEQMGSRYGVDPNLLRAVAIRESQGHPWTVNLNGEPFYLSNKQEVLSLVRTARDRPWLLISEDDDGAKTRFLFRTEAAARAYGRKELAGQDWRIRKVNPRNVDLGIMQINWIWHGKEVPSLERLVDPDYNIAYGAAYLARLIRKHGVNEAIGRYHSGGDEKLQDVYRPLVMNEWKRLRASP